MAKELMEIGGFITSGAEIVNHDTSLSGNGTVDSPLGVNETVLWSGNYTPGDGSVTTNVSITLSDGISNYEMIRVEIEGALGGIIFLKGNTTRGYNVYKAIPDGDNNENIIGLLIIKAPNDDTHLTFRCGYSGSYATAYRLNQDWGYYTLKKIVGINRKAQ